MKFLSTIIIYELYFLSNNRLNEKKIDVNKNGKKAFFRAMKLHVASIAEKMYADYRIFFSAVIATFVSAKSIKESILLLK